MAETKPNAVSASAGAGKSLAALEASVAAGGPGLAPADREARLRRMLAKGGTLVAVVLLVLAAVAPTLYEPPLRYKLNEPAQAAIVAPVDLETRDAIEFQRLREKAAQEAPAIYLAERRGGARAEKLREMLQAAAKLEAGKESRAEKVEKLAGWARANVGERFSTGALELALRRSASESFRDDAAHLLAQLFNERGVVSFGTRAEAEAFARQGRAHLIFGQDQKLGPSTSFNEQRAREFIERDRAEASAKFLVNENAGPDAEGQDDAQDFAELLSPFLSINVDRHHGREQAEREKLLQRIEPPTRQWSRDEVIARRGEFIDEEKQGQTLAQFNDHIRQTNFARLAFFTGLIAAMIAFIAFYSSKFQHDLLRETRHILAASFPVVAALLLGRLLLTLFGKNSDAGFAFPAALVGMLGVILVEARFALLLVVCASLLFGIAAGIASEQNFSFLIVSLASGFAAVGSLFTLQKRSDVLVAGFKAGAVGFVSVLGVTALAGDFDFWAGFAGFAGGLASGFLTYPCLFALEKFAGITTDIGLMELTSLRHPLLAELEEKAPGTFQHTLNVTKLAEAAAVAVGANYLLVRAGCYFHDIGKADKPKYFSENQVSPEDRKAHDKLNPHMSALIIKEHVRRGVEKAREYHLPPRVIDFIREHHGTTTIAFFYHKALKRYEESDSSDPVSAEHFRYAGPPPQSRETAIALLADSVDAVAAAKLSGSVVTRDEIRRLVRDIVNQKFREEQFNQCNLTLRDLSLIQNAFIRTLEARYHHRVKYPDAPAKRRAADSAAALRSRSASGEHDTRSVRGDDAATTNTAGGRKSRSDNADDPESTTGRGGKKK